MEIISDGIEDTRYFFLSLNSFTIFIEILCFRLYVLRSFREHTIYHPLKWII